MRATTTILALLPFACAAAASPEGPAPSAMPRTARPQDTPDRIVWSCKVESFGAPAVMVDYARRTALSTLGAAVTTVAVTGDVATWQENDADGIGYRFELNRRTRALQVTPLNGTRKGVTRRGACVPPAAKPRE